MKENKEIVCPLANQQVQFAHLPMQIMDDEISLIEILRILLNQKVIIFAITLAFIGVSVALALILPREYQTDILLLPPSHQDVSALNILGVVSRDRDKVYIDTINNLYSQSMRKYFYTEKNIRTLLGAEQNDDPEIIYNAIFNTKLSIEKSGKGKHPNSYTVTFAGQNKEQIADVLNDFIDGLNTYTVNEYQLEDMKSIENMKSELIKKIELERNFAEKLRSDRISLLKEAFVIAEKLDIIEAQFSYDKKAETANKPGVAVMISEIPLYLLGVKALKAEIESLEARKNDDPFTAGLLEKKKELAQLNQIQLDYSTASTVKVDRIALPARVPVKPQRKLIVILGAICGMFVGVFSAFGRHYISQQKFS
ncbi:MAG: hypothetical protein KKA70_15900 [Proteobacteria bacterium]|nr:hypothetical protein [Pseudomonadota bacterium]